MFASMTYRQRRVAGQDEEKLWTVAVNHQVKGVDCRCCVVWKGASEETTESILEELNVMLR